MSAARGRDEQGMSLIEVLVGAAIAAVLVGGLMGAFLTAMRISARGSVNTEAAGLVQQTLERLRNKVACGEGNPGEWFNSACAPTLPPANTSDPIVGGALFGGTRTYTVTPEDCDGVPGGPSNCLKVVAKVSWTPP